MKVEIVAVVDKSGSMSSKVNDVIGGFNSFIAEQKALPGEAYMSVVLFDTEHSVLHECVDIQKIPELTAKTYIPMGGTALLDAVGDTIDSVGKRLKNTDPDKRPDKVIFVIMTDGEENSSLKFKHKDIKEKIEHQTEKYSWEFVFIGQGLNTWDDAQRMGISAQCYASMSMSGAGVSAGYHSATSYVSNARTGQDALNASGEWKQSDIEEEQPSS